MTFHFEIKCLISFNILMLRWYCGRNKSVHTIIWWERAEDTPLLFPLHDRDGEVATES